MNKEIIREELHWLLDAINEQYEAIRGFEGKIPLIEYDILMENLRKFYDDLRLLKKLEDPYVSVEKKNKPADLPGSLPREPLNPVKPPVYSVPRQPQPSVPASAPSPPLKPAATPGPKPEARPVKKPSRPEEIDLFAEEEPAINTRLMEAREKSLGPKIPSKRIDNLKAAIIIDDKFMFINELFEGNLREYNETIETLNGFSTLDQAADYLDLMRKKNFWNTGSIAFKKLKDLVERRF